MMPEVEKESYFNQCLSEFQLQSIPIRNIYDEAVAYLNTTHPNTNKQEVFEDRIKRLMVNQIRHNYTNYDEELRKLKRVKREDQTYYYLYKNYTLKKIQEQYQYLEDACKRQKTNLTMAKRV